MSGHNPNVGENQVHYSGGGKGSNSDSAGVASGLSMVSSCECKNAESVSQNQRPKAHSTKAGSYRIGTQEISHERNIL